jgi:hypothetical protein
MRFVGLDMKSDAQLLRERNLQNLGKVQKYIDSECIRQMDRYTPQRTRALIRSATFHTKIGSGLVTQQTPYARRLYYNPQYKFAGAPMRGGYWFKRMVADKKASILKGARIIAGGG